jgi:predicted small secreted protein
MKHKIGIILALAALSLTTASCGTLGALGIGGSSDGQDVARALALAAALQSGDTSAVCNLVVGAGKKGADAELLRSLCANLAGAGPSSQAAPSSLFSMNADSCEDLCTVAAKVCGGT